MHLSTEATTFIEGSPFLFVASRSANGRVDISPRGDLPVVLTVHDRETLLMPDRRGNNRLDTIANILDSGEACLAILRPRSDRLLIVAARAAISVDQKDRERLALNGQAPSSVMRFSIESYRFRETIAFEDAGFWADQRVRGKPLDLYAIIEEQIDIQAQMQLASVPQEPPSSALLARHGLGQVYETPDPFVQRKSFSHFDRHTEAFVRGARFSAFAFIDGDNRLDILMAGGQAGFLTASGPDTLRVTGAGEKAMVPAGTSVGGLFVVPGQNETMRFNATALPAKRRPRYCVRERPKCSFIAPTLLCAREFGKASRKHSPQ